MSNMFCVILMTTFTQSPFDLSFEDEIVAIVEAQNARGWSQNSSVSTSNPTVQTAPTFMNAPVRSSTSTYQKLVITWSSITSPLNGDSDAISYHL